MTKKHPTKILNKLVFHQRGSRQKSFRSSFIRFGFGSQSRSAELNMMHPAVEL